MNTSCAICSDLFSPSNDISTTPCGHIFHNECLLKWIERSKTCPQCRKKTTKMTIIRVYFNYSNTEGITLDAGTLQNKLDFLEFQFKEKEKELSKLKDENSTLQNNIDESESKKIFLTNDIKEKNGTIKMMKEHIEYLKSDSKELSQLRSENNNLRTQIDNLKCLQDIIDGTKSEVEVMVQNMPDVNKLSTYIVILKKSIMKSESKKKLLQEDSRILQSRLQKLESEKADFIAKIKLLESSITFHEEKDKERLKSQNIALKSIDKNVSSEIPENSIGNKFLDKSTVIDISPRANIEKKLTQQSAVNTNNQANVSSPYLNLKQSNNLFAKLQSQPVNETNIKSKLHNFYILKDNKNCDKFDKLKNGFKGMAQKRKQMETVYDGLGGHFKPDIFPGTSNNKNTTNSLSLSVPKRTKSFR